MSHHRRSRSEGDVCYASLEIIHEDEDEEAAGPKLSLREAELAAHLVALRSVSVRRRTAFLLAALAASAACLTRLVFSDAVTDTLLWSWSSRPYAAFNIFLWRNSSMDVRVSARVIPPAACYGDCVAKPARDFATFWFDSLDVQSLTVTDELLGTASYNVPANFTSDALIRRDYGACTFTPPYGPAFGYLQTELVFQSNATVHATLFYTLWEPGSSYCEAMRYYEPVSQPANAYSNVAFLLTGFHMLAVGLRDRGARSCAMSAHPAASLVNGAAHVFAGCASFAFHASQTSIAHNCDMLGVFVLVLNPALYCALGLAGWPMERTGKALLVAAYSLVLKFLYEASDAVAGQLLVYVFLGVLGASLLAWAWPRRRALAYRWAAAAAALIALGAVARHLDFALCSKSASYSAFQFHAAWHALAAASLWCLWVCLRSVP